MTSQKPDSLERAIMLANGVFGVARELYDGVRTRSLPVGSLLFTTAFLQFLVLLKVDLWLMSKISLALYPSSTRAFAIYYMVLIGSPFAIWSLARSLRRKRLVERLADVFHAAGLKNNLGNLPKFVFDRPLDPVTRKLRITSSVLPVLAFQKAKSAIESGLQIYIDEFRENRKTGTVDMVYAHEPMPTNFQFDVSKPCRGAEFIVGATRSREIRASLNDVPHLLVAGQTGGGKSTFLRQFITTLCLGPEKFELLLIDLKGGLEFQLFEGLENVIVPEDMCRATNRLHDLSEKVETRLALLKQHRVKDIEGLRKRAREKQDRSIPNLRRVLIVIDEAAEMFLAGDHASGGDVQQAKRVLSRVARQGRSIGVHLVVATQRPDSRALDPQIKANLPGVLCFQMVNDISSITVLGNGRATDLPAVPGRAIWKVGGDMVEVQTPFLSMEKAEGLLPKERAVSEPPQTPKSPTKQGAKSRLER